MLPEISESLIQVKLLNEVVIRLLQRRAGIRLSSSPSIEKRLVVEFMRRMRVSSLEKFLTPTMISVINFFANKEAALRSEVIGTLVLYVEQEYLPYLLKKLDYPIDDGYDDELIKDACGTFCNLIAGNFKSGLCQLGYENLEMSHFLSYKNEIIEGVLYPYGQKEKYEISFEIDGERRIMIDLVMGEIPKVKIF